jgi:hypothetical protein
MLMLMPFRLALIFSFAAIAAIDTLLSLAIRHADAAIIATLRCSLPPLLMLSPLRCSSFRDAFLFTLITLSPLRFTEALLLNASFHTAGSDDAAAFSAITLPAG